MKTVVLWEKQAQADREAIFRYLFQEASLEVASATDDKFVGLAAMLMENPLVGVVAGQRQNQRKLTVARFPFILVYATDQDKVHILRVLHTSRKIAGKFSR